MSKITNKAKLIKNFSKFNKISYSRYVLHKIEKNNIKDKAFDVQLLDNNINHSQKIINKINNNEELDEHDLYIYNKIKQKQICSVNSNIINLLHNHYKRNDENYMLAKIMYFNTVYVFLFFAFIFQGFAFATGEIRFGKAIMNTIYYSYLFPLCLCNLIYNAW